MAETRLILVKLIHLVYFQSIQDFFQPREGLCPCRDPAGVSSDLKALALIVLGYHLSPPSSTEMVVAPDGPWTLACPVFGILGDACVPVCSGLVPSVPPSAAACPRPHVHPRLTPSLCLSLQPCRYSACPTENVAARCATRRPGARRSPQRPHSRFCSALLPAALGKL